MSELLYGGISISVIIPAHGRLPLLRRALQSIADQDLGPAEVLVIDDCSEPPIPADLLQEFKLPGAVLRLASKQNAAAARNHGAMHACGSWLAFLDSDDTWYPRHLSSLAAAAREHGADFIVAIDQEALAGANANIDTDRIDNVADYLFVQKGDLRTSGFFISKAAFAAVDGFDSLLEKHQDWDFLLRYSRSAAVYSLSLPSFFIDSTAPGRMSLRHNPAATARLFRNNRSSLGPDHMARILTRLASGAAHGKDHQSLQAYRALAQEWGLPGPTNVLLALVLHFPSLYVGMSRWRTRLSILSGHQ
jgi:glycosyltransferase involved in cell wall biosynthesis